MTEQKIKNQKKYMIELTETEMLIISATGLISSVMTHHQEFFDNMEHGIEKVAWAQAMLTLLEKQNEWANLVERLKYYIETDGVDT